MLVFAIAVIAEAAHSTTKARAGWTVEEHTTVSLADLLSQLQAPKVVDYLCVREHPHTMGYLPAPR